MTYNLVVFYYNADKLIAILQQQKRVYLVLVNFSGKLQKSLLFTISKLGQPSSNFYFRTRCMMLHNVSFLIKALLGNTGRD